MGLARRVAVVGVGGTRYERRSSPELAELRREAARGAIADAGMKAAFEIPFGWYPQVVHFAGMARRHMELYGTTEAQLGAVAVACRRHAALHDNAVLRDQPLGIEDYLAAPYLADPFRAADCCL